MLQAGVRPVFVFDGKAGEEKKNELERRAQIRQTAKEAADIAKEEGKTDEFKKYSKRAVKVTIE